MKYAYLITPFFAWLVAGSVKFVVNCIIARRLAFDLIGYGGMPSNHTAIVTSMATLICLNEGLGTPAFGVALTLAFIVVLDATSLRSQVGRHAKAINRLSASMSISPMRERMGHSLTEIIAGVVAGAVVAMFVTWLTEV